MTDWAWWYLMLSLGVNGMTPVPNPYRTEADCIAAARASTPPHYAADGKAAGAHYVKFVCVPIR